MWVQEYKCVGGCLDRNGCSQHYFTDNKNTDERTVKQLIASQNVVAVVRFYDNESEKKECK